MSAEAAAMSARSRSAISTVAVVLGCSAMGVALDLTALLLGETLALYWQRCNMLLREQQHNEYGSEQQTSQPSAKG